MSVVDLAGDPAFAAIRQYRAADNAWTRYSRSGGDENGDEYFELEDDFFAAQDEFWRVVPTTADGVS